MKKIISNILIIFGLICILLIAFTVRASQKNITFTLINSILFCFLIIMFFIECNYFLVKNYSDKFSKLCEFILSIKSSNKNIFILLIFLLLGISILILMNKSQNQKCSIEFTIFSIIFPLIFVFQTLIFILDNIIDLKKNNDQIFYK